MSEYLTIAFLIAQLSSPSWPERELATQQLSKMPAAWPICFRIAATTKDPELAGRCDVIAGPYVAAWANGESRTFKAKDWPRLPWVDYVMRDENGAHNMYLSRVPKSISGEGPNWTRYREATQLWIVDMLASGMTRKEIQRRLDEGAAVERSWTRDNWERYDWPQDIREAMQGEKLGVPHD